MKQTANDFPELKNKEKLIKQLQKQKLSRAEAVIKLSQIQKDMIFNRLYASKQKPETVGSYYRKFKEKCEKKYKNSQP